MPADQRQSERWLAWKLGIPLADLRRLAFAPDHAEYRPFVMQRRGKKPRNIDNPKQQMKFVQRRIRAVILEDLPLPD